MPILGIYASQISGHLWAPSGAYDSIATVTVGSGGQASAEFTSIPSTYTHLEVRIIAKAATGTRLRMQINNDTATNYSTHILSGDGSGAYSFAGANEPKIAISCATSGTAGVFMGAVVNLLDYKDTNKYKTVRTLSGIDNNGSGEVNLNSGSWRSTSAVTSLKFYWDTGNLDQYSSFALYGIKGA
jgi:hypothetical protein